MSNFSSLKNVPPVFQDLTTEKVWKKLREPFSIAILASLGVHGVLWFGLPLFSANNTKPNDQRTLSVVELSPLEQQARLPNAPNLLPPNSTLQPAPKASPSTSSSVPFVPISPSVPNPDTFYQIPAPSTSRVTVDLSALRKRLASKPTTPKVTEDPPPKESSTTEAPTATEPVAEKPSTRSSDLKDSDGNSPNKRQEDPEKDNALQQLFAFNAAGTSEQDYQANAALIANQIADKFNIRDWEKPIATRAPYPKDACQFQHEGKPIKGTVGMVVVMQPDGSLSDTALLVKSSGFKGLDEAARKYVEKQWSDIVQQTKIEPESQPQAYPLAITVEPAEEDCPAKPVS